MAIFTEASALAGLLLAPAAAPHQDAQGLWDQGRRAEAVEMAAAEVEARPADGELRRRLVGWELAIHRYGAALGHMRGLGEELDRQRGLALYRSSRFEEALEFLRADDAEQLLMRIDALEALGRLAEADAAVETAVAVIGAGDERVLTRVGLRHARHGRYREAADAFRAAIAENPQNPASLFGLGRALVAVGQREEGLRVLEEHRRLTPLLDRLDFCLRSLDLNPTSAHNHAAVGDAERALGNTERAEVAYRRAGHLATDPEVVSIALRYARLLSEDEHDLDAALAVLASAGRRGDAARLRVRAGDLLLAAGRAKEALEQFERARTLRPKDPAIAARVRSAREAAEREP